MSISKDLLFKIACNSHFKGFGTKLSRFFEFARSSKYQTTIPFSQLPKTIVVAFSVSVFYVSKLSHSSPITHRSADNFPLIIPHSKSSNSKFSLP